VIYSMKKRFLVITCILIITLFSLSGCYDARSIEELAYATAIGLDISDNKTLTLTIQFSIPSSNSESGSSQSSKTDIISVDCTSINSGLSLINSFISKEIHLSHCNVIVISEELAVQGISEYIDTLANHIEIRPDCNIIISRCDAKEFINNATPSIEALTARYYEVALNSSEYTGYTIPVRLSDFIGDIKSSFIQGHAILGNVNFNTASNGSNNEGGNSGQSGGSSQSSSQSNSQSASQSVSQSNEGFYNGLDSHYSAGETPINESSSSVETFGTAVFYDDKLVGELNGMETICHLIITDNLKSCILPVPDPFNVNDNIDLRIDKKRSPNIEVNIINGSPYISIEIFLEGIGLSLDENTNYNSKDDIKILNTYAEEYLRLQLLDYCYKTAKEYNSDISGFGKYVLSDYLTWEDWLNSNWLENYKNSFFDIKVNVDINSGYEFNKSP